MRPQYPSHAIAISHPARLAQLAMMHGLRGEFSGRFRYLELGCGDATNVLAIAARFPDAEFIAVDADCEAIARGEARRKSAGIANVRLIASDVCAFEPPASPFDFVVAHGIYSWVAPEVQARLLELIQRCLAEIGVGYVSYNTYPGWGLRGVLREVMHHAAVDEHEPEAMLRAARAALARVRRHAPGAEHPYGALLRGELELIQSKSEGYLLGEYLAEHNEPVYVSEFLRRAGLHGLAFVAELLPATPDGERELAVLADLLAAGVSRSDAEQTLDVVTFRQFRATLLSHARAPLRTTADWSSLHAGGFFAASVRVLDAEPVFAPGQAMNFAARAGVTLEVERPLLKAALFALTRAWPTGLLATELIGAAMHELRVRGVLDEHDVDAEQIEQTLRELTALAARRLVELLPWTPECARVLSERPRVGVLTRLEAARTGIVTDPRHEPYELDPLLRRVASWLDGTRSFEQLVQALGEAADVGELELPLDVEPQVRRERLSQFAGKAVERLVALGLVEA
ncbi:MAG: methyltransferase domain-containing protein [Myxococcales bacterium]|nr:methyltransferase domain-containing protein [Myxococcales bacterium]